MRALAACVLVLFAATLAGGVESGQACSCALPDPRAALAQADGAFVGTLVSRRQLEQQAVLVFSVERTLKGSIGRTVEVRTAANGAGVRPRSACRNARRARPRATRRCLARLSVLAVRSAELLAAALPLPPPNGRGPVALVVGGEFGDVATHRAGCSRSHARVRKRRWPRRVSSPSVPGGERLAEVAYIGLGTDPRRSARHERCASCVGRPYRFLGRALRAATRVRGQARERAWSCSRTVLADTPAGSACIARARSNPQLWSGSAYDAAITSLHAYLSAGDRRRDPASRRPANRPSATGSPHSRATNRCAGAEPTRNCYSQESATRSIARREIVRVDLAKRSPRVAAVTTASSATRARTGLLASRPAVCCSSRRTEPARVASSTRRCARGHGFAGPRRAAPSSDLARSGPTSPGRSQRAELPSGPLRVVRRLPGRPR